MDTDPHGGPAGSTKHASVLPGVRRLGKDVPIGCHAIPQAVVHVIPFAPDRAVGNGHVVEVVPHIDRPCPDRAVVHNRAGQGVVALGCDGVSVDLVVFNDRRVGAIPTRCSLLAGIVGAVCQAVDPLATAVVIHRVANRTVVPVRVGLGGGFVDGSAKPREIAPVLFALGHVPRQPFRLVLGVINVGLFLVGANHLFFDRGHALADHTQHIGFGAQGHADELVIPAVHRQQDHLHGFDGSRRSRQAPVWRPGHDRGVAVDHLIALQVAVFEVIQLFVAELGNDHVFLDVRQLTEGALEAADLVGCGHIAPIDHHAGARRGAFIAVIHPFHKPLTLGFGRAVPVAVLLQGHVHGVVVVTGFDRLQPHLLCHRGAHPLDHRHVDHLVDHLVVAGDLLVGDGFAADDGRGHQFAARLRGRGIQHQVLSRQHAELANGGELALAQHIDRAIVQGRLRHAVAGLRLRQCGVQTRTHMNGVGGRAGIGGNVAVHHDVRGGVQPDAVFGVDRACHIKVIGTQMNPACGAQSGRVL